MSSQRYQEFIAERTRQLERIRELETENAEFRKRLGELVEPVTSASHDIPDSNDSAKVKEVIFALASTMEGDTTNFYISRRLKQVSRPQDVGHRPWYQCGRRIAIH